MNEQDLHSAILHILREEDLLAAVEMAATGIDVLAACQAFAKAMRHAYWQDKDLATALALGRAGSQFGLMASLRPGNDPDLAYELRSLAKGMMYDVASFSWPGWMEPGFDPSPAELAMGMDAARSNWRLAHELAKGDLAISRAAWMLGAYYLLTPDLAEAQQWLERAEEHALKAGASLDAQLNRGYVQMARLLGDPANPDLADAFANAQRELEALNNGAEFAQQLRDVKAYLSEWQQLST